MAIQELDYMEYANDANAQAAYVTNALLNQSNGDVYTDEFTSLDTWTDKDGAPGESSQVTYDSCSCLKSDSGSPKGGYTWRQKDVGTFSGRMVVSIKMYHAALGTYANGDCVQVNILYGTFGLTTYFATDGLFIYEGNSQRSEAGTDLVQTGVWQTWTFDINATDMTVDVYLDGVLKASGMDCSYTGTMTNGQIDIIGGGNTTASRITYIDWIKLGSDFADATLQCYSEATIKTQGSYSLKAVATTDALNKTLTYTPASAIDLTGQDTIKFDIYSSRTGANIKIGIHDSGGTTTEKTHSISSANTFETDTWDISGVSDANKDAIDQIIVTITNADAANTFYIDNMYAGETLCPTFIPKVYMFS